ncbi:Glu/Leu/Phe/Val dehydrogenase dimerization domain-containing protein [Natronogracilivirga saccharolytica]|uniref:Glu/Leu/Phe/Val dehydrogenase n=1 Tax=Natronogracilivirga saccharolytica TaxID=2812953 RepID=A0A8J7S7M6_9BACT|nr:Glu/Leu/Phe/Val dehydrogenase dimerization domain-containing protein [Natronogracilivirga saccharolytica]MBP3191708.1 Glu/Leu/Phe/Val dehydrogenase [Natronogracilivirga saccharolytica]
MAPTLTEKQPKHGFSVFDNMLKNEHEQVIMCSDPSSGLKAIIAIHNTILGPSLGGVRMWPYESEEAALKDVLNLSRGMTYKSAVAGLNLGGGKAVIIGNPKKDKKEAIFRAFGRYVEGLAGRYITAEDVGMSLQDMEWIRMETKYVTGISMALGGSGDPSPVTAMGVYMGMKSCAKKVYGSDSLEGRKISIQGAGNVSTHLVRLLHKEGAKLYITDIDEEKVERIVRETGAIAVDTDSIYDVDVDIFSPNALGGVLNENTIPRLKCDIIAGGANNQIEDESVHGPMLIERGMLYAPDYVINSGGVINVSNELEGYNRERAHEQAGRIYDTMTRILEYSETHNVPTYTASNSIAEMRLKQIGRVKSIYASRSHFTGRMGELVGRR